MSHTMNIQTQIKDREALELACKRLNIRMTVGAFELYSSNATGIAIHLSGWQYPAVVNCETGKISFDNFNGKWGNIEKLHELEAYYALEKSKLEAIQNGYQVIESFDEATKEPTLEILLNE